MKKFLGGFFYIILTVLLLGCSADEVIRVGTPFNENGNESVIFDNEITNTESIEKLRGIIKNVKEIEEPKELSGQPNTFFTLDRPNDGSSILYNESSGYFALTKEYTGELKGILEQ